MGFVKRFGKMEFKHFSSSFLRDSSASSSQRMMRSLLLEFFRCMYVFSMLVEVCFEADMSIISYTAYCRIAFIVVMTGLFTIVKSFVGVFNEQFTLLRCLHFFTSLLLRCLHFLPHCYVVNLQLLVPVKKRVPVEMTFPVETSELSWSVQAAASVQVPRGRPPRVLQVVLLMDTNGTKNVVSTFVNTTERSHENKRWNGSTRIRNT